MRVWFPAMWPLSQQSWGNSCSIIQMWACIHSLIQSRGCGSLKVSVLPRILCRESLTAKLLDLSVRKTDLRSSLSFTQIMSSVAYLQDSLHIKYHPLYKNIIQCICFLSRSFLGLFAVLFVNVYKIWGCNLFRTALVSFAFNGRISDFRMLNSARLKCKCSW